MGEKLEVLISAMHQKDNKIFERTNINTDALLINQCDIESAVEYSESGNCYRIISTTERGLSKSRNKALEYAKGTYCLICDDDEILYDDYENKIVRSFQDNPEMDIICFQLKLEGKNYSDKEYKVGFLRALRVASVQVAFKLGSIKANNLLFDEAFGSGTPVGSGEENIFLYDCLRKGLKIKSVPVCIGEVAQSNSKWFKGFDEEYFYNRGKIINRLLGKVIGRLYCIYFAISKYKYYKKNITMGKAVSLLFLGIKGKTSNTSV